MKLLIFKKRLDVGGTQVNSIELAATLVSQGQHEVAFSRPQCRTHCEPQQSIGAVIFRRALKRRAGQHWPRSA